MMHCFGFLMKTVVIRHRCFGCCRAVLAESQGLFSSSRSPASEEAAGAPGAGRGHSQDSWHSLARGMSRAMGCHGQLKKLG